MMRVYALVVGVFVDMALQIAGQNAQFREPSTTVGKASGFFHVEQLQGKWWLICLKPERYPASEDDSYAVVQARGA